MRSARRAGLPAAPPDGAGFPGPGLSLFLLGARRRPWPRDGGVRRRRETQPDHLPARGVAETVLEHIRLLLPPGPSQQATMYCLQWLLPVLLIPKPLNPALWFSHSMFMGFYLLSFLLERKPCTICALVFLAALFLICYSCWGNCFLYHCTGSQLPESAHDPSIVGT
ncbi:bladder cancer-associated protein isoform X1 [Cuculus canorus]|uniref:bladder cancer-associated protein isoform X1 n=1 Tax=Cuculus canorus TaxID=55661 RepID=UPI0023AB5563|nr:bladder cancer-associated protein isoform X1 [Cuculus canorus]